MQLKTLSAALVIVALSVPSMAWADKYDDAVDSINGPFNSADEIRDLCQQALGIPDEVMRSDAYKTANDRPSEFFLWRRCIRDVTKKENHKAVVLRRERHRRQLTDTKLSPRAKAQIRFQNQRVKMGQLDWRKMRSSQAGYSRTRLRSLLDEARYSERNLIQTATRINELARRAQNARRRAAVHYCSDKRGTEQKDCIIKYIDRALEEDTAN